MTCRGSCTPAWWKNLLSSFRWILESSIPIPHTPWGRWKVSASLVDSESWTRSGARKRNTVLSVSNSMLTFPPSMLAHLRMIHAPSPAECDRFPMSESLCSRVPCEKTSSDARDPMATSLSWPGPGRLVTLISNSPVAGSYFASVEIFPPCLPYLMAFRMALPWMHLNSPGSARSTGRGEGSQTRENWLLFPLNPRVEPRM
mmetsp:Transcript_31741/g.76873  ORF Transcript_31741/g.76873 Transcript_31741/m.76873 type:complete len:201 (-) Transcript_31741:554-1156(-)